MLFVMHHIQYNISHINPCCVQILIVKMPCYNKQNFKVVIKIRKIIQKKHHFKTFFFYYLWVLTKLYISNMTKTLQFVVAVILVFFVQIGFAQTRTITGKITDESGALPGVTVLVKNTSTGTQSDINGKYAIKASSGDVLIFRFVGMNSQEITVGASNVINVVMTSDNLLDEVIVTAFGTSTKEAFTGSASVVGAEDLANRNVTSPIAAIEGRATGVQFTSAAAGSNGPGASPKIIIRGVGTLNGNSDPLFIVDGIQYEGSLNTINQDDIESFTILKDAASTSLYGSRAANGVVIIKTKSGSRGAIKVNASAQYGFVNRGLANYNEVTPGQYYESMWSALKNSSAGGGDAAYASANIYNSLGYNPFNVANDQIVGTDGKLNPNAGVVYRSLNWYDVMERTGNRSNYNMSVSGGGKNHQIFFSTSYLDEDGYLIKSNFNRITSRLNAEFDVNKWLTMGGSANVTITEAVGPSSAGLTSIANPFGFAQGMGSIYPVYVNDRQGNYVLDAAGRKIFDGGEGYPEYDIRSRPTNQGRHALQELILNDERDKDNTYGFRYFADFKLFKGLNFRLNYGRDINENMQREYENNIIGDAQPTGRYGENRIRRQVENFNQILTYNTRLNNVHNLDFTLGHESFARSFERLDALAIKQTVEGVYEFDNFAEPLRIRGYTTNKRLEGYFLRANYDFNNKYYISASVRRDGSSVFSKDSRWGTFYSVGASWRIDQEKFMDNVSFVDRLKIRGSYGEVGNDDLNDYFISQPRYGLTSNAANPALSWSDIGNSALQWETVESFDVALEFTLFNRFLDGVVEYYKKTSSDLLYDLPIALSNGLNTYPTNIGDMYNSGIELSLTGHLLHKTSFNWDLTLQASTLKNKITSLPNPFVDGSKRWEIGRSRYDYYILHTAGVDPLNGDQLFYKYEIDDDGNSVPVYDESGNHEVTNDWEDTERAYVGASSIPKLLGSVSNNFSYKGFSLGVLLTYGIGGKILDYGYAGMMHSGTFGRSLHPDIMNAWSQPGQVTDVPRMESGNSDLVRSQSSRFLTDGSFWSLKNINLGYRFGNKITDKIGVQGLRLSLTGENLIIKSKRPGLNPQYDLSGTPSGNDYSPSRIYTVGLNVSF